MYQVDVYLRIRRAVMVDGMSIREVSRVFGLHRDTVRKILAYSVPPGYRRQTPPRRPNPSTSSGVPYSTRPSGSLCRATYSDHEGLDFHWNRHAAVHWNRPPNSVDLEQREGELGLGDDGGERLLHPHRLSVKGGEKVYHCGGGIVYHRHDEKGLNWEPGGIRSGAGVRSSGVSQESTGSSDTWEAALCRLCLRR